MEKQRETTQQTKMVQLLQILLLCCAVTNLLSAEFQVTCEGPDTSVFLEGVSYPVCYCNGIEDNMTIFDWTFVHETGRLEHLATCYAQDNCTTFATYGLQVNMFTASSSIYFNNLTTGLTGTLICSETTRTFHGSTNVTMKVARVGIADLPAAKVMPFLEGSNAESLNCEHSPNEPNTLTWTIITNSGQQVQMGSCSSSDNYNCSSLFTPTITLEGSSTSSYLFFNNDSIHRNMSAVVCTVSFPDSVDADNCTLDIFSLDTIENCSFEMSYQNWSFILSCDISNAFSSQGQYGFMVHETFYLLMGDQLRQVDNFPSNDYHSYHQYLTSYTNSTNKEVYYRGRLVYSWPVSPYPGTYRSFEVETVHHATAQLTLENGFNVSSPASPTHNCSDIMTPCSCSTETLGSPAGRLLWSIGNTTVAVGDYGVNQLLLPLDDLPGGQDVTVATCKLDWIQIFVAKEPAILRREWEYIADDKFKTLTIVGWSLLSVVVVLNVIVVVILIHLGHLGGLPCKNSTKDEEEDKVDTQNYARLKTSRVV